LDLRKLFGYQDTDIIKDIHTEIILTSTPTFLEGCHYIDIINLYRKRKNFNQQLFITAHVGRERRLSLNVWIGSTFGAGLKKTVSSS
jgi:hypothetical protein